MRVCSDIGEECVFEGQYPGDLTKTNHHQWLSQNFLMDKVKINSYMWHMCVCKRFSLKYFEFCELFLKCGEGSIWRVG